MIETVFGFFSNYLIEFMGGMLTLSLIFRWFAFRQSKADAVYYSSFTRQLENNIEKDKEAGVDTHNHQSYLSDILGRVTKKLPNRSLRGKQRKSSGKENSVSLRDYMDGKQGLIASIQAESSVFNNSTQPNFTELTRRIMSQDKNWTTLLGHLPVDGVSRMIDIMPSLFIVFGVFGTFIGISMALPEIAKIDFDDLEASAVILNNFVLSVTYAMKTSIAGIFFSLILTVLNTLIPIKEGRNGIFKKVETSMQQLWYHIHNQDSEEVKVEDMIPELLATLKEMRDFMQHNHHDHKEHDEKKAS